MRNISFFLLLFFPFLMVSRAEALGYSCRNITPGNHFPMASEVDCRQNYAIGYGKGGRKTLWVAEMLTKKNVIKYEFILGHRHFEEEGEPLDPRDFAFSNLPKSHHRAHRRLTGSEEMWDDRKVNPSSADDPLGASRLFNIVSWEHLELELRHLAVHFGKIYMMSGPLRNQDVSKEGAVEGHLRLPSAIWEAVYIPQKSATIIHVCRNYEPAYCLPVSMHRLEKLIGFTPFPGISAVSAHHEITMPEWIE